jgi:photosystem II stability/assembly factor-like uncharacterized protein
MKKKLLLLLLSFLIVGFVSSFAQEDEEAESQTYRNPSYSQWGPQSIFEDSQPIYGSAWEWMHQQPNGNTLRQVKMWDADNWYAVGFGGTFLKTTDAGANWTVVKTANGVDNNGSSEAIYDFHWWDMNTGIIGGGYGTCYKTTDAGLTWDSLYSFPTAATCYDFYFVDDTLGFACGTTSMRIYKTTDGGNSWSQIWGDIASRTCYEVYAADENNIKIACSSGYFLTTTNGGTNWIEQDLGGTLYDMEFTDPMNGWVSGTDNNPSYTTDGGLTWTLTAASPTASSMYDIDVMSTTTQTLNEGFEDPTFPPAGWHTKNILGGIVWFRATDDAHSGTASARVSWDAAGGEDWLVTPMVSIVTGDSLKFWARKIFTTVYEPDTIEVRVSITDTSVASFTDVLFKSSVNDAFNTTWDPFSFDLSAYNGMNIYIAFRHYDVDGNGMYLDDVSVGEPMMTSQVYVTGDAFNIFSTTDMGTTWSPVDFLGSQLWTGTYYSTDWIASNNFVTVGLRGLINEVNPADATIAHTLYIRGGILYALWAESEGGRIIAGGAATLTTSFDQAMYSTDGGDTWAVSTMEDSADLDFNDISMVTPMIGYSAGEDYRVMKTTDGGASWFRVTDPVTSTSDAETCYFVDENTGYVFGVLDDGYKTTDGGTTWSVLTTGITATMRGSYFLDANTGWVVGSSGTCLYTTDGGATFTPQDPASTTTLYDIWMVNANVGYLCGSTGTVRKTTDGGTTWVDIDPNLFTSDPTLYDIEFRNEDNGMAAGSTGRTYFTNDGGATWTFENTSMSTIYEVAIENTSPDTSAAYICGTSSYVMRNSLVIVPVELAGFTASVRGSDVTLNWQTATETNNMGFEIERREVDADWVQLGYIEGKGTTTETSTYSFVDKNVLAGTYNYRIKQIDFDGSFEYYNLQNAVEVGVPDQYRLTQNYPNPFNPTTKITYSVPVDGFVSISIFNILGEKVTTLVNANVKAGHYEVTFDAAGIASGMYLYRMESGDFISVKKMMILK